MVGVTNPSLPPLSCPFLEGQLAIGSAEPSPPRPPPPLSLRWCPPTAGWLVGWRPHSFAGRSFPYPFSLCNVLAVTILISRVTLFPLKFSLLTVAKFNITNDPPPEDSGPVPTPSLPPPNYNFHRKRAQKAGGGGRGGLRWGGVCMRSSGKCEN